MNESNNNHESDIKCDIAGSLHDLFYEKEETH